MKILFLTTKKPSAQGDYLELTLVNGLRKVLGDDFVDYPKKRIMYGDFSESPKDQLHGRGFTFLSQPIEDVNYDRDKINPKDFDVILVGSGHIYGERYDLSHLPNDIWYTDGNDWYGNAERKIQFNGEEIIGCQFSSKCFKTALVQENWDRVFSIDFGIPSHHIESVWSKIPKTQLICQTVPKEVFGELDFSLKYKFDNEEDYYDDLRKSWFALTCKKGQWTQIRHLEAIAKGAVVLFKDYDKKPRITSPIEFPTISFSTKEECYKIMDSLVKDGIPTLEYQELRQQQYTWLKLYGTCESQALKIITTINKYRTK